jgi:hypothetical protein
LGSASTRRMVATRLSNLIGFASNSSHPVAMAFSRSPGRARCGAEDARGAAALDG